MMEYRKNKVQLCFHKSIQSTTTISVLMTEEKTCIFICIYTVAEYVQVHRVLISVMVLHDLLKDFPASGSSRPAGESQPCQLVLRPCAIWIIICKS